MCNQFFEQALEADPSLYNARFALATLLENISQDEEVVISETAWRTGGSRMFIEVDKKVSVEDLLPLPLPQVLVPCDRTPAVLYLPGSV